jgi:hypothetical protein
MPYLYLGAKYQVRIQVQDLATKLMYFIFVSSFGQMLGLYPGNSQRCPSRAHKAYHSCYIRRLIVHHDISFYFCEELTA